MANPNFIPDFSTNQIFRDLDQSRCLTDDLDDMDDAIGALENGKADLKHTHTGYAAATHGHTDYAPVSHEHSGYANSNHTHTGFAAANHTHDYAAASHNHSYNDLTDKPTIPAAYTHPASHPAAMIDGLAGVATSGSYNDLSDKPTIPTVPASLPANGGNADTVDGKHADEFAATSHTHTDYAAADHAHTAYASAEHTHANYAATTHNHDTEYIAKALQMVADDGGVVLEMAGQDVTATIAARGAGVTTGYCPVNSTNAPNSNEAWRFLIHKMSTTYGWVLAFGSYGSVYANYINDGVWRGWKNLVDGTSNPLWYDNGSCVYLSNTDTVTPSKALNQCRNGWVLVWSDSDTGGITNNADTCTTVIPKRNTVGALWGGQSMLCPIAGYQATDTDTDVIRIKRVYVHNDKLVGHAANAVGNRCDIALRAVYEY